MSETKKINDVEVKEVVVTFLAQVLVEANAEMDHQDLVARMDWEIRDVLANKIGWEEGFEEGDAIHASVISEPLGFYLLGVHDQSGSRGRRPA